MGQVPPQGSFLLLGSGRVARHFAHYFTLQGLSFATWSRADGEDVLRSKAAAATHVLFLISDNAVDELYRENAAAFSTKKCVHFSGALVSEFMPSAHPLMTFAEKLYDLESYRRLPFIFERDRGSMQDVLPGLPNPSIAIDAAKKPLYHSLCVMGGNFSILLWEKVFQEFENQLGLPKQVLLPFLLQITENLALAGDGQSVLTGPLVRGDRETIERNLAALGRDPFADVYRAFVIAFQKGLA